MSFGRAEHILAVKKPSKHREEIICLECLYLKCTNRDCPKCPSCLEESCKSKTSCTTKPNRGKQSSVRGLAEDHAFYCLGCKLRLCEGCGIKRSREFHAQRNKRCKECSHHPSCKNLGCRTCKACRDPLCKTTAKCAREPEPLNHRAMLALDDIRNYEYDACLLPACHKCGITMPEKVRSKSQNWKAQAGRTWLCTSCTSKEDYRKTKTRVE